MTEAKSKIVYIATGDVEAEWEAEYNRWYDEEHVPNLMQVPGYRSARRYVAIEGEPRYMAFYEIDSLDAYRSPEHDRAAHTPWRASLQPHYRSRLDFYGQLSPAEGLLRGAAWGNGAAEERGLLVVRLDVAPEHEEELEEWYGQEHLPALVRVPGVIGGRTFKAIEGTPKYMAVYHLADPAAQASPAWEQAAATPWTLRMRRLVPRRWRVVYRPVG